MAGVRRWDVAASRRVTHYIANSAITQERIAEYYGRESTIIHPPVDVDRFSIGEPEDWFLVVTEVVRHKRVEIALEAARRAGKQIKVVGTGPDLERLKAEYAGSATFVGRIGDEELTGLYSRARAMVVPNVEEFGIAAVEGQAAGRPVARRRRRRRARDRDRGRHGPSRAGRRRRRARRGDGRQRPRPLRPAASSARTRCASQPRTSAPRWRPRWLPSPALELRLRRPKSGADDPVAAECDAWHDSGPCTLMSLMRGSSTARLLDQADGLQEAIDFAAKQANGSIQISGIVRARVRCQPQNVPISASAQAITGR